MPKLESKKGIMDAIKVQFEKRIGVPWQNASFQLRLATFVLVGGGVCVSFLPINSLLARVLPDTKKDAPGVEKPNDSIAITIVGDINQGAAVGGADHDVFGASWTDYNHETKCNGQIIELKRDSNIAMVDYDGRIPLGSSIVDFSFIPTGQDAINIGYGRRTLYEFMFGDGDKQKISLKYDTNNDGMLEFVPLYGSRSYSTTSNGSYLKNEFNRLTEVGIRITETMIGTNQIKLRVDIGDDFFESTTLPVLNTSQYNRVYMALSDYSIDGENQTAAEFVGLRMCD